MGRFEARIFALTGTFFAVGALIYALVAREWIGTVMLVGAAAAWFLLFGYLSLQAGRTGPRPEDRDDGTFEEAAGAVGYFPVSSMWPFVMGSAIVVVFVGLVFGPWFVIVGGLLLFTSIVGYAIESQSRS